MAGVRLHCGNLSFADRHKAIADLSSGQYKVLVATNVLSHGIDAQNVVCVLNYGLNMSKDNDVDVKNYSLRIGRCGRFGKRGIAISFIKQSHFQNIQRSLNYPKLI